MRLPGFVAALHGLLARGCRLGFIGGSDNHERNPGLGGALTGVWAEANTRDAIFAAFQARRAFATTGVRADVRFGVAGAFMGGATVADTCPVVELTVAGGVRVTRVEVIRDGQVRFSEACSSGEVAFAWEDRACPVGEHYYYAHVQFAGQAGALPWNRAPAVGVDAWSSPVWVTRD